MATNITDEQIKSAYQRVNWNAKNWLGMYPCRSNPCYSYNLVQEVLKAYEKLRNNGKIVAYTPKLSTSQQNDIAHQVALQSPTLGGSTNDTQGKVKGILFEWYWGYEDIKKKNSGGGGNTKKPESDVPIVYDEANVKKADGLVDNSNFLSSNAFLIGAGILGGVGIFMLTKNKKKGKGRRR